jgi:hypothetical protein
VIRGKRSDTKSNVLCYKKFFARSAYGRLPYVLKNTLEESAVLHTRILCDVFLNPRKQKDDIILRDLLSGWPNNAKCRNMKAMHDKLKAEYGESNDPASACWDFNKRLAHATSHRDREYDYREKLDALYPLIHDMVRELESLSGRHFRLQFDGATNSPKFFGRNVRGERPERVGGRPSTRI